MGGGGGEGERGRGEVFLQIQHYHIFGRVTSQYRGDVFEREKIDLMEC